MAMDRTPDSSLARKRRLRPNIGLRVSFSTVASKALRNLSATSTPAFSRYQRYWLVRSASARPETETTSFTDSAHPCGSEQGFAGCSVGVGCALLQGWLLPEPAIR